MAAIGKRHKSVDSGQNFGNRSVGCVKIIDSDKFPNLIEIQTGFRVEVISGHELGGERRTAALFSRK